VVDVGKADAATEGLAIRYFADGEEVTDKFMTAPPVIDVVYSFVGVPAGDQCVHKTLLDALLAAGGAPFPAVSTVPNELCPEFDIVPASRLAEAYGAPYESYTRLLLIEVLGEAKAARPVLPPERIAARLEIAAAALADKGRQAERLRTFLAANINGVFHFLDVDAVAPGARIEGRVFRGDDLLGAFPLTGPPLVAWAKREWRWLAAAAAALVLVVVVWLLARGRGKPLREIVVGYGPASDYSLGGGPDRAVARITRFTNGRIRIERMSPAEAIAVNGKRLKRRRDIRLDDDVVIEGKVIRLV
jgi:hypothetical protein